MQYATTFVNVRNNESELRTPFIDLSRQKSNINIFGFGELIGHIDIDIDSPSSGRLSTSKTNIADTREYRIDDDVLDQFLNVLLTVTTFYQSERADSPLNVDVCLGHSETMRSNEIYYNSLRRLTNNY